MTVQDNKASNNMSGISTEETSTPFSFQTLIMSGLLILYMGTADLAGGLLAIEAAFLALAPFKVIIFSSSSMPTEAYIEDIKNFFFKMLVIVPFYFYFFGIYSRSFCSVADRFKSKVVCSIRFFAIMTIMAVVADVDRVALGLFTVAFAIFLPISLVFENIALSWIAKSGWWGRDVVIIGPWHRAETMARLLLFKPELGLRPVSIVLSEGSMPDSALSPVPVLSLADYTAQKGRIVPFGVVLSEVETQSELEARLGLRFKRMFHVPMLSIAGDLFLEPRDIGGFMGFETSRGQMGRWHRMLKRALDIVVAGTALLFVGVLILGFGLAVKLADGGPAFYSQIRIGQGNRKIRVWKIRTMYSDADARLETHLAANPEAREEWERFVKLRNDPRILPGLGHILRRLSLDELPQLWNVVRGDMSLVGPRPFPQYHINLFDEEFQQVRSSIPPGLTGFWQISSRSDGDLSVQRSMDLLYIRNWSWWLDLFILYRTFHAVFSASGAR